MSQRLVSHPLTHPRKCSFIFQQLLQENRSKSEKEREEAIKHAMQEEEDEEDEDDGYLHGQTGDLLPDIDVLRTFSPMIVHEKVIQQSGNDVDSKQAPATRTHYAAVLFADISGFTRLANVLSVEQLQLHISKYFTKLFSCVERFGGDILKICGDAILIMWLLEKEGNVASEDERRACAITASLCGRELIQSCGTYTAKHGEQSISLSLHCGVGIADVRCFWVGKAGRWEFLITGPVLAQIAETEPEAKSGEVVVSAQVHALTKDHLVATPTPRGNFLLTHEIAVGATIEKDRSCASHKDDPSFIPGLCDHPSLDFDRYRAIATAYLSSFLRSTPRSLQLLTAAGDRAAVGLQHYVHRSARSRIRHLGKVCAL